MVTWISIKYTAPATFSFSGKSVDISLWYYVLVRFDYILPKGTSEIISWILQPYNIHVTHEPSTTLQHLPTNVKDRDKPNNRQGAVYKIKI